MENVVEKNPLGYEKVPKLLLKFAFPSVVAMLVSSLYNIVDQIFIGHGVGYLGNAATNVSYPLTTICLVFALLIGIGASSRFSISLGEKNEERAKNAVVNAIILAIVFGILYCIIGMIFLKPLLNLFGATTENFPYAHAYASITIIGTPFLILNHVISNLARADGSPRYSMLCMVVGAILNTILDPIFMFAFSMGIKGAALATIISQIVSCFVSILYLFRFRRIKLKLEDFKDFDIKHSLKIMSLGLSNATNQLALLILQIVINNSLTYYGALSIYGEDIPLSAFGLVMKINSIFLGVFIGINQGAQPIYGFNYGAKKYDRVKEVYKWAISICAVLATIAFCLFEFTPHIFINLFGSSDNELYVEFMRMGMRIYLSTIVLNAIQLLSANFFSAIGKPQRGVILVLARQVVFVIPFLIVFPLFFGVKGILYATPTSDIIAFIITLIFIVFEMKKLTKMQKEQEDELLFSNVEKN